MLKPKPDTIRPGTRVLLEGEIEATVTANTIRQNADGSLFVAVLEVTWWDGAVRHCQCVEPWEATPLEDRGRPGF